MRSARHAPASTAVQVPPRAPRSLSLGSSRRRYPSPVKRTVLSTVFHRPGSHVVIGSQDMQEILLRHSKCMNRGLDRWDEAAAEWTVSESEASALADAIALRPHLPGTNLVSVRHSPEMSGTEMCALGDGLTASERAASLITFLRGGECRWRFITEEDRTKQFPNDRNA